MGTRRVVVTGMGIHTTLGHDLDTFYRNLLEGRSGITRWSFFDDDRVYSRIGGDLSGWDASARLEVLRDELPEGVFRNLRKVFRIAPFSTRLSMSAALDAWRDAGLGFGGDGERHGVIVGGHNLNERYFTGNAERFREEPDWIDAQCAVLTLDTDHASSIGQVLGCRGASYTLGGACASASLGLRGAVDEIRHHGHDVCMVVGATLDFSVMGLHAMALLGAISFQSFNDEPERASRPYDRDREGFVPSHGTGALVLESLEHALARGARIYAEVLGVVALSDANHLPTPSTEGQERCIRRVLTETGTHPEEVDFVCAHATSTPLGDVSELGAIRRAFGTHAERLKINAPKSMLGHTCWSAPAVETIAALLQMHHGRLHPSINIDSLDPRVDLDVCADGPVDLDVRVLLKNAFGFGGINCCALFRSPHDA